MKNITTLISFCFLVTFIGCVPTEEPVSGRLEVRPAIVAHMDMAQKKLYVTNVKGSLKVLLQSAEDVARRKKPQAMAQLRIEGDKFIRGYVAPILLDREAVENLDTRLEVAKLFLLTSRFYLKTDSPEQSRMYLSRLEKNFGDNNIFMNAGFDRSDIGCGTMQEGVTALRKDLASR